MSQPTPCPRCGASLEPGAEARGLCPACLLRGSLGISGSVIAEEETDGARAPAPDIAELAPHFPQLAIESLVARGGMGAVYRAVQQSLGRTVALKVLDPAFAARPGFTERFAREARALAQLAHPNIVAVHEHGQAGPWCYLVMEFVEGASLRQMIRARSLAPREALAIVAQVCDALQYAHDHGVVHRDIKPENILVDRRGSVRVLDFGLAKLVGPGDASMTRGTQVMGTPHYMAPEQWERPLEVDHRADIYSLGVVFYELLTNELPVGRFAPPSRRVQIDVRLDGVVLRTLEREPELRYQQASDVKSDVENIRISAAAAARPASAPRRHIAFRGSPARARERPRASAPPAWSPWPAWLEAFLGDSPPFVRVLVFLHLWLFVVGGIVAVGFVLFLSS